MISWDPTTKKARCGNCTTELDVEDWPETDEERAHRINQAKWLMGEEL